LVGVLILKRVEEVGLLTARQEFTEHRFAIGSEGEFLDKANFVIRTCGRDDKEQGGEKQTLFHKKERTDRGQMVAALQRCGQEHDEREELDLRSRSVPPRVRVCPPATAGAFNPS
jgi:hypothetical protein